MKKLSSLLLVLVMIFSLCGCEEEITDSVDTTETTTATTQAETESEEVEEDIVAEETPIIVEEETESTSPVVYRTETGEKYHRENCIHLKSKIETTVEEALSMGLGPCSVCQPPQ